MALALDLQDFLLRARVLKLYRQALRITRRAPVDARGQFLLASNNLLFNQQIQLVHRINYSSLPIITTTLETNRCLSLPPVTNI